MYSLRQHSRAKIRNVEESIDKDVFSDACQESLDPVCLIRLVRSDACNWRHQNEGTSESFNGDLWRIGLARHRS